MKHIKIIFLILILFSCTENKNLNSANPIKFSIEEFDIKKNQMKVLLEITNPTNKILNEGKWSFHWN